MLSLMSLQLKIFVLICIIGAATAKYSDKTMEGYPEGLLGDCLNKSVTLTKEELKYLVLVVRGWSATKRPRYNYYQRHLIANDSAMDWKRKTMIYIGGYGDSPDFPNGRLVEKLYILKGYNVMMLDASFFHFSPFFPLAYAATRDLTYYTAEMLVAIYNAGKLNPAKIEMLGISLGCHGMGLIGKHFFRMTGKKIGRLTGLDPSGPCFRHAPPEERLDEAHGEFVEAIHTNIDVFGMAARVGHVDFYVNGGEHQFGDLSIMQYCDAACSHMRSLTLWISVLAIPEANKKFIAIKCDSVQQARSKACYDNKPMITNTLGFRVNKTNHGVFYLSTTHGFPYYKGVDGLKKENEELPNFFLNMYNGFKILRNMNGVNEPNL